MDLATRIAILCMVYKSRTETAIRMMNDFHNHKIRKSRKKFERRLRKQLEVNAEFQQELMGNVITALINEHSIRNSPRMWMKPRCSDWWTNIVNSNNFDEWMENFRIDKTTFQFLCEKLRDELEPNAGYVRTPLSVEKKIAIAIYKLASCAEYRVVANQFGVHKTSVYRCLKQFCAAVIKILLPEEIKIPTLQEWTLICQEFEEKSSIPGILGAIDGCHIPVKPPLNGYRDYINRKMWASVVLQGVVDAKYRFLNITVQHPGSTHDAVVLKDSALFRNFNNYERPVKHINGKDVKGFLIGDPAYPLLDWLVKGYVGPRDEEEESFNVYLSKARIVVENAFGKLKSRWRILQKRIDAQIEFVPSIIATCCVLHNICENAKLSINQAWVRENQDNDRLHPQPQHHSPNQDVMRNELRELIKHYMAQNYN